MVDGVKDGTAANGVTTYMEEESRRYWESGKATFMRNWPYAYALSEKKGTAVAGKFKVDAVPVVRGRRQGGHPRRPQRRGLGLLEEPRRSAEVHRLLLRQGRGQKETFDKYTNAPTLASVYDDPDIQKKYPFATELKEAVIAGQGAPGLAGLPADLPGDLHERQRGAVRTGRPRGGDEEGGRPDQQGAGDLLRPWPSPLRQPVAPHRRGGAPGASRSAAWRSSWSPPSMALIALVALWPVIYGDLAVAAPVQPDHGRALALGLARGARQLQGAADEPRLLDLDADHVRVHDRVGRVRDDHRPRHGAGDEGGVQGPGRVAHGRARAVGRADRRDRDHVEVDLRRQPRLREPAASAARRSGWARSRRR